MARIRTIKPDFFRHEGLQDLEREYPGHYVMLVFAGLWTQCDKAGRFVWSPRTLKLDILPFLDFDIEKTLMLLERFSYVARYVHGEKLYGEVVNFTEHQRISGKEAQEPAKHPQPVEYLGKVEVGSTREATGKQSRSQERKGREGNGVDSAEVSPEFLRLPLAGGKEAVVTEADVEGWSKTFPAVDVRQELRECRQWNVDHPAKRKTANGWRSHVSRWLAKVQDRGGSSRVAHVGRDPFAGAVNS